MTFIWGTRIKRRSLGRAADFYLGDALEHMDGLGLRIGRKLEARQVHAWLREGRLSKEPGRRCPARDGVTR